MSGRSVNLTTLFLGRLRPPKRLTSTSCTYFPGFIRVREMSGKFKIFQGQGIVREFHNLSGKIEFLLKCQGILEFQMKFRFSNKKKKKRNTENG